MIDEKKEQKKVKELERDLIAALLILVSNMDTKGRRVSLNQRNIRLASLIPVFKKFNSEQQIPYLKDIFKQVKGFKGDLDSYYRSLGFRDFKQSHKNIKTLNDSIAKYINDFSLSTSVRLEIQGILTSGIASNVTQAALATAVKKEVKGKLQKYYQQFMWDEIAQIERIENNFYAAELGLNWFIYEGGLIETSRAFCVKRNGKLFNRKDAAKWRFDPTLPQPETADTYQPLVELGRFNCRHWLRWITDEQAKEIKGG